jgi:hypothetical protein
VTRHEDWCVEELSPVSHQPYSASSLGAQDFQLCHSERSEESLFESDAAYISKSEGFLLRADRLGLIATRLAERGVKAEQKLKMAVFIFDSLVFLSKAP